MTCRRELMKKWIVEASSIGALIIRIGSWGPFSITIVRTPPKIV